MHPQTKYFKDRIRDIGLDPNDFHIRTKRGGPSHQPRKVELVDCTLSNKDIFNNAPDLRDIGFDISPEGSLSFNRVALLEMPNKVSRHKDEDNN